MLVCVSLMHFGLSVKMLNKALVYLFFFRFNLGLGFMKMKCKIKIRLAAHILIAK